MVLQQQAFHLAEQEELGIHCVPQMVFLIEHLTSPPPPRTVNVILHKR